MSPNQFVAACSDTVRNAWVEISVLMPGETAWKLASVRRREIQAAARLAQSSRDGLAVQPAASSGASSAASSAALSTATSAISSADSPVLQPASAPAPPSGLPANTRFAPSPNAKAGAPAQAGLPPYAALALQPEDEFAYPVPQEQFGSRRQCSDRRDPRAPLDRRDHY